MAAAIIVADTSVLINFLNIDRMDLLGHYPRRFLATDHVRIEIEDSEQHLRYDAAVVATYLDICTVTDPDEVELFMRLEPGKRLGAGECSAIAVALSRNLAIAIDDNRAVNRALREANLGATRLEIIRTPDVIVTLIRQGTLSVPEADQIKDTWERHHRFKIKATSFRDLL